MRILKSFYLTLLFALAILTQAQAATVTGTIKYDGDVPKFKEIQMGADAICAAKHSSAVFPETLVVGDGNGMANVFVYVKSGLTKKDYPIPSEPAIINQEGCQYTPHVLGVRVGQKVKFLNPDGTMHNVHAMCKLNPEFNLAMPKFRTEVEKVFDTEEFIFPIKCDAHSWMGAYVAVMSHPFFNVTLKDGKFTISGLEAGTYEIEAWHEKLGTQSASVTVGADETKTVDFTFKKPGG